MADQLTTPASTERRRRNSPDYEKNEALVEREIIHPCVMVNDATRDYVCSTEAPDHCQNVDAAINDEECVKFCWSEKNCGTEGLIKNIFKY